MQLDEKKYATFTKCFQFGEIGHLKYDCPQRQSTTERHQRPQIFTVISKQLQYEPRHEVQNRHYQLQARRRVTPPNQRSRSFQYVLSQQNRLLEMGDTQRKQISFGDTVQANQGARKAIHYRLYPQPMHDNQILLYQNIQYKQIRVHAKQSIIVSILNRCTTIKSCNIKIPYRSRDLCRGNDLMIQQLLGIRQRGITNPVMVFILHVGQGR